MDNRSFIVNIVREKMRYLSNRIVAFWVIMQVLYIIILAFFLRELPSKSNTIWKIMLLAVTSGLLNVCFYKMIIKPYDKWEKIVRR